MSELDDLRLIAQKVAEMQPWSGDEVWPCCVFCGLDYHDHKTRGDKHAEDCTWIQARKVNGLP